MKKFFLMAATAAIAFGAASCNERPIDNPNLAPDGSTGFFAVKVDLKERGTRGSSELVGSTEENALKSVYLVTFDALGAMVAFPDAGFYLSLTGTDLAAAQGGTVFSSKVGGLARKVMAIVNPGEELLDALNGLNAGSTYAMLNAAIADIDVTELHGATGFTMVSSKKDTGIAVGATIDDALIDIDPAIVDGTTYADDQAAIDYAVAHPIAMTVERLTSKVFFKPVVYADVTIPTGSAFEVTSWTVDAVNETYFPFAQKTLLSATHLPGTPAAYTHSFYTEDPNYADNNTGNEEYHSDIAYATIGADKVPVLPWNGHYGWKAADTGTYLVENTMHKDAQRYGNATRIVIKGYYTPAGFTPKTDWFSFGGYNYQTLADLQAAAAAVDAAPELIAAGNAFAVQMGGTTLAALTEAQLAAKAPVGGEWAKVPLSTVGIRFYQGGLNYWFYEIRHNGEANATMAYSKYGVVRNNWYNCTLTNVRGAGTPWYPDLRNPGDGDPKPWDPIDSEYGYIGIEITPQPWIVWENGMII